MNVSYYLMILLRPLIACKLCGLAANSTFKIAKSNKIYLYQEKETRGVRYYGKGVITEGEDECKTYHVKQH